MEFDGNSDDGIGANGGLEYEATTITHPTTVSGTFDNADIIAGTDFVV